jgi:hypothetical protein
MRLNKMKKYENNVVIWLIEKIYNSLEEFF